MTRSLTLCALFLSAAVLQACGDASLGADVVRHDGGADGTPADLVRDLPTDLAMDAAADLAPDAVTCTGANPAARTCRVTVNDCIPSSCRCVDGSWHCTADCPVNVPLCADGGAPDLAPDVTADVVPDAVVCSGANPAARTCRQTANECIPSTCYCDARGVWGCTADCRTSLPLCADGGVVTVDASACPAGQVLRYESAGCGAQAKPVCGSGMQDACFRPVCSCKGETISRCDYASEPFAAFGVCPGFDGGADAVDGAKDVGADRSETADLGGEASVNPCAKCTATEVCVQWFDGTCHTSGAFCRAVSDTCRSKLSAAGVKSCKTFPECDSEFCVSPYQCKISPPCGTEATEAAMYCYGP